MTRLIIWTGMVFFLMACQQGISNPAFVAEDQPEGEYVTTSLEMVGEWVDMQHRTETRATSSNDLYWLEVSYALENSSNYSFYGYELFDDPQSVKIKMLKGYKYDIGVSVVKNGKTLLWKDIQKTYYRYPIARDGEQFLCTNQFVRSSSNNQGLSTTYGRCRLQGIQNNYTETELPDLERYFGRISDYVPVENGGMRAELYRLYFGLKLVAEGLSEVGGQLKIEYETKTSDGTKSFVLTSTVTSKEWKAQWPYDIALIPATIRNSQKVMTECQFRVKWTSADGSVRDKEIASQKIFLERNQMNVIRVGLSVPATKAGIQVRGQSVPMVSAIHRETTDL